MRERFHEKEYDLKLVVQDLRKLEAFAQPRRVNKAKGSRQPRKAE